MDKKLSRRNFLQVMAASTAGAMAVTGLPAALAAPAKQDMAYNEAPMLADLVASGSLPSAADRLPTNPRVVTPRAEVGQYGGTWHRAFKGISDRWGPTKLHEEMAIEWDAPDTSGVGLTANYISEWTQNDDATEFTFTLRDGIKWSDGEPFTTADVQFWYDYFYMGELANKEDFYTLKDASGNPVDLKLEVIDELTWKINFPGPNPLLPIFIAKSTGGATGGPTMAVPMHYLKEYIPDLTSDQAVIDKAIADSGVGTWQELFGTAGDKQGPIMFWFKNPDVPVINTWRAVNQPTSDPFVMERNPYYWIVDTEGNQLPYIDRIEHALFDDSNVFDLWVAQGRIDMQYRHVNSANYTYYKENEEAGDYHVVTWRAAWTSAVYPNINAPDPVLAELFDTPDFRQALSISINRAEINDLVYSGLYEPRQASPVTGSPNFDPEFETKWTEYDPDAAGALLDGLGLTVGDDGVRVRSDGQPLAFKILHQNATGTPQADEIQLIEDYWNAIGLKVSQDVVERSLYEERVENGEVEVGNWSADRNSVVMADPGRYLGSTDDGPWAPLFGHWYDTGSANKKLEPPADHPIRQIWSLWEQTKAEPDEAKRNALFKELLDIHKEHPWMIGTVGEAPSILIVKNNFMNVPDGFIDDDTLRGIGYANPYQFFIKA